MKAILEYNLPEDNYEFKVAKNGGAYLSALEDIYNWFRSKVKYAELNEAERSVYEDAYEKFYQILEDNDVKVFEG